jgi:hypothetical protein
MRAIRPLNILLGSVLAYGVPIVNGQCLLSENAKLVAGPSFTESWALRYRNRCRFRRSVCWVTQRRRAYVFRSGDSWVQEQKSSIGGSGALLGWVSLSDDVAVVVLLMEQVCWGGLYLPPCGTAWSLEQLPWRYDGLPEAASR